MSMIVKADATGAVTLPAELCQAAGVAPGADLLAEVQDGRIVLERRARPFGSGSPRGGGHSARRIRQIAARRRRSY